MQVCVQVYARMSNKHLGQMMLPKTFGNDVFREIRHLQEQGAKLLTHPKRPCEYLQVFLDGQALPTLTYKTQSDILKSSLVEQVVQCFEQTTCKTRVELMWNEDDTKALKKLKGFYQYNGDQLAVSVCFGCIPPFKILAYALGAPDVAKIRMYAFHPRHGLPRRKLCRCGMEVLALLASMNSVTVLDLQMLSVPSWDFASKTRIKVLILYNTDITLSDLAKFPYLEDLTLEGDYPLGGLRVSALGSLGLTRLRVSILRIHEDQVESFKDDVCACKIDDVEITFAVDKPCLANRAWQTVLGHDR